MEKLYLFPAGPSRRFLLTLSLWTLFLPLLQSQVRINEFMASNGDVVADETGRYGDWIELYNPGTGPVDLGGFFLSDDDAAPARWSIPEGTVIEGNGYLLIWADGRSEGLHTNFSLNRQQEMVLLSFPDTSRADSVYYTDQLYNISCGRDPGHAEHWGYFQSATPGSANETPMITGRCQPPVLGLNPGFYDRPQQIPVEPAPTGVSFHYTLDGSVPTAESPTAGSRINVYATAPVRIRAFREGYLPSRVVTGTYLIGEYERDVVVVSLATDPDNLWDDEYGIHVVGTNGTEAYGIVANYNQEWERPISVELFETGGKREFQVDAGVKISGQYSRKNEHKSLAFHMRSRYGYPKLDYPLFPDKKGKEYNNFLLRNSGSEWVETMFGDAISQYIVKDQMDLDYMAYRPAAVFLNGEYWGILNLREKINEHYPASNYGIPAEDVILLESSGDLDYRVLNGSNQDYMDLRDFVEAGDMTLESSVAHIRDRIELEHYTDYQITEIYENNTDWPGNNIKYWKDASDPSSRWRWIMYDLDRGFGIREQGPDYEKGGEDNLVRALSSGKYNFLLSGLMENPGYREYFIRRFNAHIHSTFHPWRVNPIFDRWRDRLENEMTHHMDRWGQNRWDFGPYTDNQTMAGWRNRIEGKKQWARERPPVMMGILKEYFSLGDTFRLELSVNDRYGGKISVNGVTSPLTEFGGPFFEDFPVELEALPEPGYRFVEWEGLTLGKTSPICRLRMDEPMEVRAIFAPHEVVINEIMADNKSSFSDNAGDFDDWIEIVNRSEVPVDLGGMYLSDSAGDPLKWRIPERAPDSTTVPPGGFLVIWADGEPHEGVLHTGFRLGKNGESVTLSASDGITLHSSIPFGQQYEDRSWGSYPDAASNREFMPATPGAPNRQFGPGWNIRINEVMASNAETVQDEFLEYDDWFELYNGGPESVDLAGFFLTDNLAEPLKYRIPEGDPSLTTLPAGGFLMVWADGDNEQGPLHTTFKLSAGGEEVGLTGPDGVRFLDSLIFHSLQTDIPFGRLTDGEGSWSDLASATPGSSNLATGLNHVTAPECTAYPNPFRDQVRFEPGRWKGLDGVLALYDLQGRRVRELYKGPLGSMELHLHDLPSGIYLLRVSTSLGTDHLLLMGQ